MRFTELTVDEGLSHREHNGRHQAVDSRSEGRNMHIINESLSSTEFRQALAALAEGRDVRRSSWPDGQFLRETDGGIVAVFRNQKMSAPSWSGPSVDEMNASDWRVL